MNHKGFTLIELMVTLAILTIATSMAVLSVSNVASTQAGKAADEVSSLLSQCRIDAMSRTGDCVVTLYMDGKKATCDYLCGGQRTRKVLSSRITISYGCKDHPALYDVAAQPLSLSYHRETGAFLPLDAVSGNTVSGKCDRIVLSGGGNSYQLILVPSTGNHRRS